MKALPCVVLTNVVVRAAAEDLPVAEDLPCRMQRIFADFVTAAVDEISAEKVSLADGDVPEDVPEATGGRLRHVRVAQSG